MVFLFVLVELIILIVGGFAIYIVEDGLQRYGARIVTLVLGYGFYLFGANFLSDTICVDKTQPNKNIDCGETNAKSKDTGPLYMWPTHDDTGSYRVFHVLSTVVFLVYVFLPPRDNVPDYLKERRLNHVLLAIYLLVCIISYISLFFLQGRNP